MKGKICRIFWLSTKIPSWRTSPTFNLKEENNRRSMLQHGPKKKMPPFFYTQSVFFRLICVRKSRGVVGSQDFANVEFPMAPHQTQGHLMDLRFAWRKMYGSFKRPISLEVTTKLRIWEWDDDTPENEHGWRAPKMMVGKW